MRNKTYKVIVKLIDNRDGLFQSQKAYVLYSIHGAAGVTRHVNGREVKPDCCVGDRLDLQTVKEIIDNPENDVTVTL